MDSVDLAGQSVPVLGVGTMGHHGAECRRLVHTALDRGYRHVDTGQYYGNEDAVGEAVAASGLGRENIWVTTKFLHPRSAPPTDLKAAAEESLRRLRLEYVDAMLVHWLHPDVPLSAALEALVSFRDEGKARVIGVCNFPSRLLREAIDLSPDLGIVQVEYHPYLSQRSVLEAVQQRGMVLTAHSPLARGEVLRDATVRDLAARRGLTPAQVVLRWLLQQDRVVAIPGSSSAAHLEENLAALAVSLDAEDMTQISALSRGRRLVDPPHAPHWERDDQELNNAILETGVQDDRT